jgi:hypothetical protein
VKAMEEAKNKGGRPRKVIDKKVFESLCEIQCTKVEMCGILDCDEKTLTKWCKEKYNGLGFSDTFKLKGAVGKMSLRRKQMEVAMAGNTGMLIWLGKQWLGQADKQEFDLSGATKIQIVENDLPDAK